MPPVSRPSQPHGWAAQVPMDHASMTASQVIVDAQPYDPLPLYTAPPSVDYPPFPHHPFIGGVGSIGPIGPLPFTFNPFDGQVRPVRPLAPSLGINQGFIPTARRESASSRQSGFVTSSNAVQQQTRHLLHGPPAELWRQENPSSQIRHYNDAIPNYPALQTAEGVTNDHLQYRYYPPLPNSTSPSSFNPPTQPTTSVDHTYPLNDVSVSQAGGQTRQNDASDSSFSAQSHEYTFLQYGQPDPSVRSLPARKPEDIARIDAIHSRGGVCGPCGGIKKRCDDGDHCNRCKDRRICSYATFLASLRPVRQTSELENISLHELKSTSRSKKGPPTEPARDALIVAQDQVTIHVNSWFRDVTRIINPTPFDSDRFDQGVSLEITSDDQGRRRRTCFKLGFFEISNQVGLTAYPIEEERLLTSFVGHSSSGTPPTPSHGELPSQCVKHLTWVICNTFAFLKSLPDADIFSSINNMPAARATVSIAYASLYRLLLSKADDFCSFVLASWKHDFRYCLRRPRTDIVDDSLRGLAQYYRVVTGIANLELRSSPELMRLFSGLRDQARKILKNGGLKDLIVRVYGKTRPRRAKAGDETAHTSFKEIMSSFPSEVPEIKLLTIALRVDSGNSQVRPTPTEALRSNDPYHQNKPIKVRDLLKESHDPVVGPGQLYVDDFVDRFPDLQRTFLEEPGPSNSCPGFSDGQEAILDWDDVLSEPNPTSLGPEHASLRPSQQATETRSIKSEVTVQNEVDFHDLPDETASPQEKPVESGWRDVLRGKGCKRRERSDDSQNSRRGSGQGNRKHAKLDSGRESPIPCNYFDVLTYEPEKIP